jgi:hypothetical protein
MQTPDFGALELDDRGELLVSLAMEVAGMDGAQATAAAATVPPPYPSRTGTPNTAAGLYQPVHATPTTLDTSAGQFVPTMPPTQMRKVGSWIACIALLGAAGTAIAVVATRTDSTTHVPATTHDAGDDAIPPIGDATMRPLAAIDAWIPDAGPPYAGPADAVPADTLVDAAPAKRPSPPHSTTPAKSSATTIPSDCDRSVDIDCDGIPDVR